MGQEKALSILCKPYGRSLIGRLACFAFAVCLMLALSGCGSGSASSAPSTGGGASSSDTTTGDPFVRPELAVATFDPSGAVTSNGVAFDTSHLSQGYIGVSATSEARLKFEMTLGETTMYFDLPSDGTPIICPLSLGDGTYTFSVWENTTGNRYAKLAGITEDVIMDDEFQPFLHPNLFTDYDASSAVVQLANDLTEGAENDGDALKRIYDWIVENVSYDDAKAERLADGSGYIPNPDSTLAEKSGICFDYASLAAAMLRSQGIPCQIVTGNVAPDGIYHAWNMVYIDGSWVNAFIDVASDTWTRIDTTFAASGSSDWVGNGSDYSDRYIY